MHEPRYTAHDYDAAWQVLDNVTGRSVGGSFTEAGAMAEAARLNARMPARATDALAWGIVRNGRLLHLAFPGKPDHIGLLSNERIARVRITEIEQEASDGD